MAEVVELKPKKRGKRRCAEKTKAGKPCRAWALHGEETCLAHSDAKTRESVGFVADNGLQGRPRQPRVVDVMRERVEERIEEVLRPYFEQLTGAVLHATFKGDVYPSKHPDTGARIEAAERLLDRIYGKPTQPTEERSRQVTDSEMLAYLAGLKDGSSEVVARVGVVVNGNAKQLTEGEG